MRCTRVRQRSRLRWKELQARATDGQTAPCLHPWRPVPKQTEQRTTDRGGCVLIERMQAAGFEATHTTKSGKRLGPRENSSGVCACDAPELANEATHNRTRHSPTQPTQLPHSAQLSARRQAPRLRSRESRREKPRGRAGNQPASVTWLMTLPKTGDRLLISAWMCDGARCEEFTLSQCL